jgi:hypothetical protein
MKTISKSLAAVVAFAVLSTGAYSADRVLKRIDHPNGPDTFAYVPVDRADRFGTEEVAIAPPYSRGRVVLVPERRIVVVPADTDGRHLSYSERREVFYYAPERW